MATIGEKSYGISDADAMKMTQSGEMPSAPIKNADSMVDPPLAKPLAPLVQPVKQTLAAVQPKYGVNNSPNEWKAKENFGGMFERKDALGNVSITNRPMRGPTMESIPPPAPPSPLLQLTRSVPPPVQRLSPLLQLTRSVPPPVQRLPIPMANIAPPPVEIPPADIYSKSFEEATNKMSPMDRVGNMMGNIFGTKKKKEEELKRSTIAGVSG